MAISSATLLIVLIALPFGGSGLAALFPANARNAEAYLAGGIALAALVLVVAIYPHVVDGGVVQYKAPWIPELGLDFNLRMDGLAWVMAALITGIGFLVVLYARYYMSPADPVPRFFSFLLAFMGAMLGIVLSGNLIQLVFFWELTSLFSFLLIGYRHQTAQARDGARMALIITSAGGLCLFAVGPEVCGVDAFASHGPEVILGLKVFEVESKPENILVLDLLGRGGLGGSLGRSEARPSHAST